MPGASLPADDIHSMELRAHAEAGLCSVPAHLRLQALLVLPFLECRRHAVRHDEDSAIIQMNGEMFHPSRAVPASDEFLRKVVTGATHVLPHTQNNALFSLTRYESVLYRR